MRWHLIIVVVLTASLTAALVFVSQFLSDSKNTTVSVPTNFPIPDSDGPPYVWDYSANGRMLGTPYFTVDGKPAIPEGVRDFTVSKAQESEWHYLWYQLLFLDWLQRKGAQSGQIAAWTALIAAWVVYGVDRLRQSKARRIT